MSSDQLSVRLSLRQTPQFVDIDLEEDEDSSDEEYCPDEQEDDDTADEVSDSPVSSSGGVTSLSWALI